MISVPNHQRLSSGNSLKTLCGLLIVLFLVSCGGTDRAVSKTRSNTKRVTVTKNPNRSKTSKIDTVQWTEATDTKYPPIVDNSGEATALIKEEQYDVTYLLPLKALDYASSGSTKNMKFINYFSGLEMAKEILEREGVKLNINIVDSEKRNIESVLSNSVNNETDVMVGLFDTGDLQKAATLAKDNGIPLISPWKASSKVTKSNPYYIQLRPNLDEYYKTIVRDIVENYKAEQVYILGRNNSKDKKIVNYVQRIGKAYFRSDTLPFNNFVVEEDSLIYGEVAFDSIFNPELENVVIIPNFSNSDEPFVYNCTRRLSVEKGMAKMTVYGMELLIDSDKIGFDQYNALNMKCARTKFVDEADSDVQRFKTAYFNVYGSLPTDDAYEGYDNLMFIGRNISKYGKNFQHFLDRDNGYYLQAAYDVQKTFSKGSKDDDFKDINYFENKHVDIISFDGRRFRREPK